MAPGGIAVMITVAAACASIGRASFREPVVTCKDAAITGLGISSGSLDLTRGGAV